MIEIQKWRWLLPLLTVVVAVGCGYVILDEPEKQRKFKSLKSKPRIVAVQALAKGDYRPSWQAAGPVSAAETIKLYAQVTGVVAQLNPDAFPGGQVQRGGWLLTLEEQDYQWQLRSAQAQVVQAQTALLLEKNNQLLAREELTLLDFDLLPADLAMVLRKPQIASAQAKLDSARAGVERAQRNLARTSVVAPFTAAILSKLVGTGSKVSSSTVLFELVNLDQYRVEVKVPRSFLPLLDRQGKVRLSQPGVWSQAQQRVARVESVLPALDKRDRQLRVLLTLDDPSGFSDSTLAPVFINDFLEADLPGIELKGCYGINGQWLLQDNAIWVVDSNDRLRKRAVEVLFRAQKKVYIHGQFQPRDRALATEVDFAVEGMLVRPRSRQEMLAEKSR